MIQKTIILRCNNQIRAYKCLRFHYLSGFPRFFYVQSKNPSKIRSIFIGIFGISYASVPLYRMVCQKMGWAGTPIIDVSKFTPDRMIPLKNTERIRITFNADVSDFLNWKFVPQQKEIY
ncbi:hypothetical protein PCK2_000880, partial [Pneumocystis canis]